MSAGTSQGLNPKHFSGALTLWATCLLLGGCVVNPVPTPFGGADEAAAGAGAGAPSDTKASKDGSMGSDSSLSGDTKMVEVGASDASAADGGNTSDTTLTGNTGLSQAGAQDFGQFRQILEAGGIPTPPTLDDLGFFAEHKLDYPNPTCGQDMCMHGLLGIMGNMITGSTCTVVQIGLNTPIQVDKLKRPPLDLVLALDVSASMQGTPLQSIQQGLQQMLDHLKDGDTVSLVTFAGSPKVVFEALDLAAKGQMAKAIIQLQAGGKGDLFGGSFVAFGLAHKLLLANKAKLGKVPGAATRQSRVILLSDGEATAGLQDGKKLVSLATGYAKLGIGITTIGVSTVGISTAGAPSGSNSAKGKQVPLLRDVAEIGAGNFYFLDSPGAVKEVFTEEVETFLVPVALDVRIQVTVADGYLVRGVYGTHGWKGGPGGGLISIPTLFLAGRTDSQKPIEVRGTGRRGGGGAILVELVPLPGVVAGGNSVGKLDVTWTHPSGVEKKQSAAIEGPFVPGSQIPDEGFFTHPTVEKGFVMLNLYAAFQMACSLALDADPGAARGVLEALQTVATAWVKKHPDPDIEDDLKYVALFIKNLKKVAGQTPVSKPPEPWPKD